MSSYWNLKTNFAYTVEPNGLPTWKVKYWGKFETFTKVVFIARKWSSPSKTPPPPLRPLCSFNEKFNFRVKGIPLSAWEGGGKYHDPETHHTFEKPRQQACEIRHKLVPRRRGGQLRDDVTGMLHQGRIEFSLVLFLSFNVVVVIVVLTTSLQIHICTLGNMCIYRYTSCIITTTYLGHENIFHSGTNALKVSISL